MDLASNKEQLSIGDTLKRVHFYKVVNSDYKYYVMAMYTDIDKAEGISIDFDPLQKEIRFYVLSNNTGTLVCAFTPTY